MRRIVGFVLLAAAVGLVVMLFVPGAGEIAGHLGKKCPRTRGGTTGKCGPLDVIVPVVFVLPWLLLIGLYLVAPRLVARPRGDGRVRSSRARYR